MSSQPLASGPKLRAIISWLDSRASQADIGPPAPSCTSLARATPIRRIAADALSRRLLLLALLLGGEILAVTIRFDSASWVPQGAWLTAFIHISAPWVARCLVGFAGAWTAFALLRHGTALAGVSTRLAGAPFGWGWLIGHVAAIVLFAACSVGVYGGSLTGRFSNLVTLAWICIGAASAACAALACLPWAQWVEVARATGRSSIYAFAAAVGACSATPVLQSLWRPASRLTFSLVEVILRPLVPGLTVEPDRFTIYGPRFGVQIADTCSGLEGLGLLLAFAAVWLFLFRDQLRFPNVLALIPVAAGILFLTNAVRIAALLLIGNAGAPEIALGGFHSQAGWIAFCLVSICLVSAAHRIRWASASPDRGVEAALLRDTSTQGASRNPVAPFLMPFLAILAAGMLSRAASGSFEWLYPLRFSALVVLWVFRHRYSRLDWRFGWPAPVAGAVVFVFWIVWSPGARLPMPVALSDAPVVARTAWIALRILEAAVAVPLVEELAFRGYLLRRFVSPDFESVSFRAFGWFPLVASSLLFGLLHGAHWVPGLAAGLTYGLVTKWRGRIGDAVAAHATSNALLAIYVLRFQQWQLW